MCMVSTAFVIYTQRHTHTYKHTHIRTNTHTHTYTHTHTHTHTHTQHIHTQHIHTHNTYTHTNTPAAVRTCTFDLCVLLLQHTSSINSCMMIITIDWMTSIWEKRLPTLYMYIVLRRVSGMPSMAVVHVFLIY